MAEGNGNTFMTEARMGKSVEQKGPTSDIQSQKQDSVDMTGQ